MDSKPYQADDIEVNIANNEITPRKPKSVLILATAALAMGVLAFAGLGRSNVQTQTLTNFAKTPKVLTPEQQAAADAAAAQAAKAAEAAAKEAEVKRISALPKNYLPAADYKDPCDAIRDECCTDERYPILGGMDLVHFKLTGEVVFGNPKSAATIQGISRTYTAWFSEKSMVAVFEANPEAYLPKWGGFDAGQFCSTGGGLTVLEATTVDLSSAQELNRGLAFASIPVQNPDECDTAFNSFYGSPVNGIYNTRCVSMSHFKAAVPAGLLPTMPELAVPVPMSKLYGIQASTPTKNKMNTGAVNPFDSMMPQNPFSGGSKVSGLPGAPPKPSNPFGAPSSPFGAPAGFAQPPPSLGGGFPGAPVSGLANSAGMGEKGMLKKGMISDVSSMSPGLQAQMAGQPMGEKAMVKRGMEDPSMMSPGLKTQYGAPPQSNPFGAPIPSNPFAAPQFPAAPAPWHP